MLRSDRFIPIRNIDAAKLSGVYLKSDVKKNIYTDKITHALFNCSISDNRALFHNNITKKMHPQSSQPKPFGIKFNDIRIIDTPQFAETEFPRKYSIDKYSTSGIIIILGSNIYISNTKDSKSSLVKNLSRAPYIVKSLGTDYVTCISQYKEGLTMVHTFDIFTEQSVSSLDPISRFTPTCAEQINRRVVSFPTMDGKVFIVETNLTRVGEINTRTGQPIVNAKKIGSYHLSTLTSDGQFLLFDLRNYAEPLFKVTTNRNGHDIAFLEEYGQLYISTVGKCKKYITRIDMYGNVLKERVVTLNRGCYQLCSAHSLDTMGDKVIVTYGNRRDGSSIEIAVLDWELTHYEKHQIVREGPEPSHFLTSIVTNDCSRLVVMESNDTMTTCNIIGDVKKKKKLINVGDWESDFILSNTPSRM